MSPPRRKTASRTSSSPAMPTALHSFRWRPILSRKPATAMRSQRRKQRQPRRQHSNEGCRPKETRWPNPETPASSSSPIPTTRIERAPASRSSLGLCMPPQSRPDQIIRWKMLRCPQQHTTPRQKQDGTTARDGCSRRRPHNTCRGPSEDTHEHHPPMGSVAHAVEVPASAAKPVPRSTTIAGRRPPEEGARFDRRPPPGQIWMWPAMVGRRPPHRSQRRNMEEVTGDHGPAPAQRSGLRRRRRRWPRRGRSSCYPRPGEMREIPAAPFPGAARTCPAAASGGDGREETVGGDGGGGI